MTISLTSDESEAQELLKALASATDRAADGEDDVVVPRSVVSRLQTLIQGLLPPTVLSTQRVAQIMGVSRPYVVKLIDNGELPAHRVGRHRRVRADDLERYLAVERAQGKEAFDELVRLSDEMGLYQEL